MADNITEISDTMRASERATAADHDAAKIGAPPELALARMLHRASRAHRHARAPLQTARSRIRLLAALAVALIAVAIACAVSEHRALVQSARDTSMHGDAAAANAPHIEAAPAHADPTLASSLLPARIWVALALGALAGLCVVLIARLAAAGTTSGSAAERPDSPRESHAQHRTQAAILRLLDEMGDLANGDLTVHANVNEDVTGAVADAINYAVGELRRLVIEINAATTRLAGASSRAQATTLELLNAAQRQSQEIAETNAAVEHIAAAIERVSARAAESAQVATESRAAAAQGADAVRRAIGGMDAIREHIQDTAKRIKRLGESSQEIGEIVVLISDITERTNILALNATIQVSAAGPAGRGFALVAEEIQRLAERSAQASSHIGAIVKTIQTDTQDATSAMERSTQGVVAQTELANAAGRTLSHIDEVTRRLAASIQEISATTREQAAAADRIRATMADILRITELTSAGTRDTADSTAQLAALAAKLRRSVAHFKVS